MADPIYLAAAVGLFLLVLVIGGLAARLLEPHDPWTNRRDARDRNRARRW